MLDFMDGTKVIQNEWVVKYSGKKKQKNNKQVKSLGLLILCLY